MLRIFTAAALTIGVPLMVFMACYAVSYIPFVKRGFDLDENDSLFTRVCVGFVVIVICIVFPIAILFVLLVLFVAFYGLL